MNIASIFSIALVVTLSGCGGAPESSPPSALSDDTFEENAPDDQRLDDDLWAAAAATYDDDDDDDDDGAGTATGLPPGLEAHLNEIRQKLAAKYDVNKDGKLDPAERQTALDAEAAKWRSKLDTDGNGQLSSEELAQVKVEIKAQWDSYKQKNPAEAAKLESKACEAVKALYESLQANGKDPSKSRRLARLNAKCASPE